MYGQQSLSISKKCDGECEMLLFIFLDFEIITLTCGIGSRGGRMQAET